MQKKILNYLNNLNFRQVMILAGVAAVIMFASIYLFLTAYTAKPIVVPKEEPTPEEVIQYASVVVAKSDIAPRMMIRKNMVELKDIPAEDVPNGAITSISDVVDLPARITILAGDVITNRKIYKDADQSGFVGTIPPDCRAVSINVNDVTGVAGFAKPGDYVDLLLVENNGTSATSNIILQNVLLLSINQSMDRGDVDKDDEGSNSNAAIRNPSIVTVALRPHEALKLISASKLGDIYLMLRPAKPIDMYVDGMEYKVISANAPPPKEETTPAVEPVTSPQIEPDTDSEPEKKEEIIEIIEGDEFFSKNSADDADNKSKDKKK